MGKVKVDKGNTFERYEKKYLLDATHYNRLMAGLEEHMRADEYGLHTICSLYYDTADFAVIRRCQEKPAFRQKLRLRSYGVPGPQGVVYLELKKKMAGITYKRRVPLALREAEDYMATGSSFLCGNQIMREIDWYAKLLPLEAKVVICYDRIALQGLEDPSLRVTFDRNPRFREYDLSLQQGDYGRPLLQPGQRLMEVKTMNALPLWLSQLLAQHGVYPTNYSKYGTVCSEYLAREGRMRHVG